jgi:hypothetical protein
VDIKDKSKNNNEQNNNNNRIHKIKRNKRNKNKNNESREEKNSKEMKNNSDKINLKKKKIKKLTLGIKKKVNKRIKIKIMKKKKDLKRGKDCNDKRKNIYHDEINKKKKGRTPFYKELLEKQKIFESSSVYFLYNNDKKIYCTYILYLSLFYMLLKRTKLKSCYLF